MHSTILGGFKNNVTAESSLVFGKKVTVKNDRSVVFALQKKFEGGVTGDREGQFLVHGSVFSLKVGDNTKPTIHINNNNIHYLKQLLDGDLDDNRKSRGGMNVRKNRSLRSGGARCRDSYDREYQGDEEIGADDDDDDGNATVIAAHVYMEKIQDLQAQHDRRAKKIEEHDRKIEEMGFMIEQIILKQKQ